MNKLVDAMSKNTCRTLSSMAAIAVLVVGCGGDGDGGDPFASTAQFPVDSTISAFSQSPQQFNLSGTVNGQSVTLSYNFTPSSASSFEGKQSSTAIQTLILKLNGAVSAQTSTRAYFAVNPFIQYGAIDQNTGVYTVFNQTATYPVTAIVGQSGSVGTSTSYNNSTKSQVVSRATLTWSLEADTASTALFCQNTQVTFPSALTGSECYQVDTTGKVLGLAVTVTVNGTSVTLR